MKNTIFDALNQKEFKTSNVTLHLFIGEDENQYFFELSGIFPEGEVYCEEFEIDKSDVSTECDELSRLLALVDEDFDMDKQAVMWYQEQDQWQKSLQTLLEDAWEIKKCLEKTCCIVNDFIKLEKSKINTADMEMGM